MKKNSSNELGLPSRLASKSFERLKKFAHDTWSVIAEDDVFITRKMVEEFEPFLTEADVRKCNKGDQLILFIGGSYHNATFVKRDAGMVVVDVGGATIRTTPDYLKLAQKAMPVRMVGINRGFMLNNAQYRVTNVTRDFITAQDRNGNEIQLHPETPVTSM